MKITHSPEEHTLTITISILGPHPIYCFLAFLLTFAVYKAHITGRIKIKIHNDYLSILLVCAIYFSIYCFFMNFKNFLCVINIVHAFIVVP